MNYVYIRFSTDRQDERQQLHSVESYCRDHGLQIDKIETDEGVSGKIPYKERKLNKLITRMSAGDTLIVSELSRLGRSMCDLHRLVTEDLKDRGIRLIVIKAGIDLDCANLRAIDEMVLQAFAFSAQLEREMIAERTKSALEARRKAGQEIGGTISLWGSRTGRKDRQEVLKTARQESGRVRSQKAKSNDANLSFRDFMAYWQSVHGPIGNDTDWESICSALNEREYKTPRGMDFNPPRARSMWQKIEKMYRVQEGTLS